MKTKDRKKEGEITVCKNCGNEFALNFCNNCGQTADTSRFTWGEIYHHLSHATIHYDHSLLYSIKQLATRPGHTIREYLEGKRVGHFNPFLMIVLLGALYTVLFTYFKVHTVLSMIDMEEVESHSSLLAHKFFAFRTIVFCILCSIGDFLFFREKKYNLPEMFVANAFFFCGVIIIQFFLLPFLALSKDSPVFDLFRIITICSALVYLFIARYQLFQAGGNPKLIFKIILALIVYFAIIFSIAQLVVKPNLG